MAKNPPKDVAVFLAAAGIGLTLGTNIFHGPTKIPSAQVPKDAVFITGGSGASPDRSMSQAFEIRMPIVHVLTRESRFEEGDATARDVNDALQGASITGYLDVVALESEPNPVVTDSEGLHYWRQSFQLTYQQGP